MNINWTKWRPWVIGGIALVMTYLLAQALRGLIAELSYAAVVDSVRNARPADLWLAVLAMLISYVSLSGYDRSSLRYVGANVPYRVVAQTSFIAYALANTIGLGVLTGGAVRMRLYGAAGVEASQISRAIAFNAAAFTLGIATVGAATLLWGADTVAPELHIPANIMRAGAALVLAGAATLIVLCRDGRKRQLFGRFTVRLPSAPLALRQLVFSAVDIAASAAVLWCLLPSGAVSFPAFVGFYSIATVLGVLSHVPGGLGVFETIMLVGLKDHVPTDALAGALVLYRLIYHVLPLLLALALIALHELRKGAAAPVTQAAVSLAPVLLAAYTLVVGVVMLVSGVTPATEDATQALATHVPLPIVEAAHFFTSIAGLALLFVARGMLLRLDAAWWAGLFIGAASVVLSLPKGIALSEAALISFLVAALAVSRKQFNRRASLLAQPFTGGWLLSVATILVVLTGLLFFAYRDVEYTDQLWWQFEFDGHAPRSLRALMAVALLALVLASRQLLRPPAAVLQRPQAEDLERAASIVKRQAPADSGIALLGDKYFLFSRSGNAFIMFGRRGRSCIALFDPVGPEAEWPELVWRFIEMAREQQGRAAFYQVRPQTLPVYLDAGLHVYKLGEYAYVPLQDFSIKGKNRGDLRQALNRADREGISFEIVTGANLSAVLAELRQVSDAWLEDNRAAEKSFSLGAFSESYLIRQPVAVARQGGRIVAFASILATERKAEVSVDLMRSRPDAPRTCMDFLFAKLLLHFQAQGFERFGLGMAPLSGMASHPLAPRWHRVGRLMFAHGEYFYRFRGLRAFKEKFAPQWEARYLAAPGGAAPLRVLTDVATLIGGGLKGVVAK